MTLQVIEQNQVLVDQGQLTLDEAEEKVREYMLGEKEADCRGADNSSGTK